MNIFARVKEFFMNLFRKNAEKEFNVDIIASPQMENAQSDWQAIIKGIPYWAKKNTKTINFAKFLCYLLYGKENLHGLESYRERK